MKVVQLVTGFDINYPGGITNYVRSLHNNIVTRDVDSKIICSEMLGDFDKELHPDFLYNVSDSNKFSFWPSKSNSVDDNLIAYLEELNPDIIHVHTVYGLSEKILSYFITQKKIKYVISIHDYYLLCPRVFMMYRGGLPCRKIEENKCDKCISIFEKSNFLRKALKITGIKLPSISKGHISDRNLLYKKFMQSAAFVYPVSRKVEKIFKEVVSDAKYKTINIGNDSALSFVKKKENESETIRVAFIGTLNKAKGAELFLNFVKDCKNSCLEFCFYGRGDSKYISELSKYGVINYGSYKPSELARILSDIDLGMILPLWEDNGPQVVMELINNDVPVLATSVGGIPDFVTNGVTGVLFDPDCSDDLTKVKLWLNSLTRKEINTLKESIEPLKTVEMHTDELIEEYKRCIQLS